MRILHVASEYPPHKVFGLGRYVAGLSRALAAQGHEVHVLTNSIDVSQQDTTAEGVQLHGVNYPPPPKPPTDGAPVMAFNLHLQQRSQALGKEGLGNPEVVVSHDWLTAIAGHRIARRWGLPHIWTVHDTVHGKRFGAIEGIQDRIGHQVELWAAREADFVLVNSSTVRDEVLHILRGDPERMDILFPGIEPESCRRLPEDSRQKMFRSLLAGPGEFLITFVGRLDLEKGIDTLINAFALLKRKVPASKLAIAGSGVLKPVIEDHVKRLSLSDSVFFPGYLEGKVLRTFYGTGDVHVCPSNYEPFGMVALEAMAAGTPIVVSETGGLKDIVPGPTKGRRVPPKDPGALAAVLAELAVDKALRRRLGAEGQRHVRETFGWPVLARRAAALYLKVVESGIAVSA